MANTTDNSTCSRSLAGVTILLLLMSAAAGLSAIGGAATPAAVRQLQRCPRQSRGRRGSPVWRRRWFRSPRQTLQRLAELRRAAGGSAPGRSSDWQQFESQAAAILTSQRAVETLTGAAAKVADNAASIVSDAELLFDYSSSRPGCCRSFSSVRIAFARAPQRYASVMTQIPLRPTSLTKQAF